MEIVKSYKYLGVTICTRRLTTLYADYFTHMKQKAERRLQSIKHYGFHKDGLRPETAIKLYKLLVRPILEYGAQVLIYDNFYLRTNIERHRSLESRADYVKQLEQFQTKAPKYLVNCSNSTPSAIIRLFAGVEPLSCRFDLLKLKVFWKISCGDEHNVVFKIYQHRRKNFWKQRRDSLMKFF